MLIIGENVRKVIRKKFEQFDDKKNFTCATCVILHSIRNVDSCSVLCENVCLGGLSSWFVIKVWEELVSWTRLKNWKSSNLPAKEQNPITIKPKTKISRAIVHFILDRSKYARLEGPNASAEGISTSLFCWSFCILSIFSGQSKVQTVMRTLILISLCFLRYI